jgi:glucose/mannose-6-phosphate isomerase
MNLDDPACFTSIDSQNYINELISLAEQLENGWNAGLSYPLGDWRACKQIVLCGLGSDGIAADILACHAARYGRVPVFAHHDYGLPAWALNQETLVILLATCGIPEEILSIYEKGINQDCRILFITQKGNSIQKNIEKARIWHIDSSSPLLKDSAGQATGLALAVFNRLGILPDAEKDVKDTIAALQKQLTSIRADSPVCKNPAKRLAGQFYGRHITIIGAEFLVPVARRWKQQINRLAKACAQYDLIPEADHDSLAGLLQPEDAIFHTMVLFLRSGLYLDRNLKRINLTQKAFMLEGVNTDFFNTQGNCSLAHQWSGIQFGDFTAYYLAMLYETDPAQQDVLDAFKKELEIS